MVGINSQGPNFNQPKFNKNAKNDNPNNADTAQNTNETTPTASSITASAIDLMGYANQALINRPTQALSSTTQKALTAFDQVHQMILAEFQHVTGIENKAPALAYEVLNRHYKG